MVDSTCVIYASVYDEYINNETEENEMTFTKQQIETLKAEFCKINAIDPKHLDTFHAMFAKLEDKALVDLSKAGVKFVSLLAKNACVRRGLEA